MQRYLLLLLTTALAVAGAHDDCTQTTPCVCAFPDGTVIDLEPIFSGTNTYLNDTKDNTTVFYHGCTDVTIDPMYTNISTEHCRNKATICIYDAEPKNLFMLGNSSLAKFAKGGQLPHTMTYAHDNFSTTVQLVCTPEVDANNINLQTVNQDMTQFSMILYSRHVCRTAMPHVLSTGTKLLIMLFAFTLAYVVGGALLAYFVRGARGRELIPNVDFWTSLPGLVKDGAIFLLGGCSTRLVTTAEAYDQI